MRKEEGMERRGGEERGEKGVRVRKEGGRVRSERKGEEEMAWEHGNVEELLLLQHLSPFHPPPHL